MLLRIWSFKLYLLFRVNLDLRVENKAMKDELAEKTQLLRTAYDALEEQEREMLRERSEFESRIESLRQSVFETQVRGKCDVEIMCKIMLISGSLHMLSTDEQRCRRH